MINQVERKILETVKMVSKKPEDMHLASKLESTDEVAVVELALHLQATLGVIFRPREEHTWKNVEDIVNSVKQAMIMSSSVIKEKLPGKIKQEPQGELTMSMMPSFLRPISTTSNWLQYQFDMGRKVGQATLVLGTRVEVHGSKILFMAKGKSSLVEVRRECGNFSVMQHVRGESIPTEITFTKEMVDKLWNFT